MSEQQQQDDYEVITNPPSSSSSSYSPTATAAPTADNNTTTTVEFPSAFSSPSTSSSRSVHPAMPGCCPSPPACYDNNTIPSGGNVATANSHFPPVVSLWSHLFNNNSRRPRCRAILRKRGNKWPYRWVDRFVVLDGSSLLYFPLSLCKLMDKTTTTHQHQQQPNITDSAATRLNWLLTQEQQQHAETTPEDKKDRRRRAERRRRHSSNIERTNKHQTVGGKLLSSCSDTWSLLLSQQQQQQQTTSYVGGGGGCSDDASDEVLLFPAFIEVSDPYTSPRGHMSITSDVIIWTPHCHFKGVTLAVVIFRHSDGFGCLRSFQSAVSAFQSAVHPKFVLSCSSHTQRCLWSLALHMAVARARGDDHTSPYGQFVRSSSSPQAASLLSHSTHQPLSQTHDSPPPTRDATTTTDSLGPFASRRRISPFSRAYSRLSAATSPNSIVSSLHYQPQLTPRHTNSDYYTQQTEQTKFLPHPHHIRHQHQQYKHNHLNRLHHNNCCSDSLPPSPAHIHLSSSCQQQHPIFGNSIRTSPVFYRLNTADGSPERHVDISQPQLSQ
eukprot:GHVS01006415.1.p1 GENE.GHVS01006415.1~~GHVS01006415.1.p1  ORF type:complete len:553 (-),score=153.12 GHVS01006415.1:164-1822(-)